MPVTLITQLLGYVEEDCPHADITSEALGIEGESYAVITAGSPGVIAGIEEVQALFNHFGVTTTRKVRDGDIVTPGVEIFILQGEARTILLLERTALNILGRMGGIATKTRVIVEKVRKVNPKVRIAATRKTAPGCRALDKRAVTVGGGDPHRFSLSDGILIKDNHLGLVPLAEAVRRARQYSGTKFIEVEVERPEDAIAAAEAGVDILMLDNMNPELVRVTLDELKRGNLRDGVSIEISGGVTESSVTEFAALDVDFISLGRLTHSVPNFDVSLEIRGAMKTFKI